MSWLNVHRKPTKGQVAVWAITGIGVGVLAKTRPAWQAWVGQKAQMAAQATRRRIHEGVTLVLKNRVGAADVTDLTNRIIQEHDDVMQPFIRKALDDLLDGLTKLGTTDQ